MFESLWDLGSCCSVLACPVLLSPGNWIHGFKSSTEHDMFDVGVSISVFICSSISVLYVIGAFNKNPLSLPRKRLQHNVCFLFLLFVVAVGN